MSSLLTGATGFIGRHLLEELVRREGEVLVLTRPGSRDRMERTARSLGPAARVVVVEGDLTEDRLGVDPGWVDRHRGEVDHVFHLAASYDLGADEETNRVVNVEGTRHALDLAAALEAGCFHHVSSIAVAGTFRGTFDETMFDEGQALPTAYHRTKFESERLVREQDRVPWRVYRPAIVVGHSETGEMDKVDGPYYFFGLLKRMRDLLPSWLPMVGVDLGDTNLVPVDYVAAALDYLAHLPGRDGEVFHLVNPEPQPTVEVLNSLCAAARAPRFAVPVDRSLTALVPAGMLPAPVRALRPARLVSTALRTAPAQVALSQTVGRLGIPNAVLENLALPSVFASRRTEKALAGSGISVPDLDSYAATLWSYWESCLDDSIRSDAAAARALSGKTVVITGASSGIGRVTAVQVAKAGAVPILVARGKDKLEATKDLIERQGGTARVYGCDLSDLAAIDALCAQLVEDVGHVDFVVNNAGRSIRRSLRLSEDRFHDFERTMALNYFGAIRLVMGLLPTMREQGSGHVVNVSSIGVLASPPRFSAYVASKAALDAWSNVVSSEVVGDGVSFTTIHMPLVRTPMIAPTTLYDRFPTISPGQAARKVVDALVDRPHEINTLTGNLGALAHTLAPKTAFRVLHLAYRAFPDSSAAKQGSPPAVEGSRPTSEQLMLSRVLKGVHW